MNNFELEYLKLLIFLNLNFYTYFIFIYRLKSFHYLFSLDLQFMMHLIMSKNVMIINKVVHPCLIRLEKIFTILFGTFIDI